MRIAPHRRPYAALRYSAPLLAATVLVAATGCSSGSGAGSKQLDALRHLPSAISARQVTYIDSDRVRALSKADPKRYRGVSQPASALLNSYAGVPWGDKLSTDQIDTAVDAQSTGHWDGSFDAAAVTKELEKHGFTSKEQDGKNVLTSKGSSVKIAISDSELVYSTGGKVFAPSDPDKSASLAGVKDYQQIADCLGDVYRADYNSLSTTKDSIRISAVGQAEKSGKNSEVLCVVARDKAAADKMAANVRTLVKKHQDRYHPGTEVTTSGGDHPVVRMAVPDSPKDQVGRLILSDYLIWNALED